MAIYVTGDIHGNPNRFSYDNFPVQKELTKDDYVIILGDFGMIWSGDNDEHEKLDWLNERSFTTLFIDGNHENFDLLSLYPIVDYHGGKAHKIRDNIYHLMRGYIFDIDGKKFFAFGGAKSHDIRDGVLDPNNYNSIQQFYEAYNRMRSSGKVFRVNGISWWKQEIPDEFEMERGINSLKKVNNTVDFVIAHCAPQSIASIMGYPDIDKLTVYFDDLIVDGLKFDKFYFGHYHRDEQVLGRFICMYERIVQIA